MTGLGGGRDPLHEAEWGKNIFGQEKEHKKKRLQYFWFSFFGPRHVSLPQNSIKLLLLSPGMRYFYLWDASVSRLFSANHLSLKSKASVPEKAS